MSPMLTTKLFAPSKAPHSVIRSRLIARLDNGLSRKLTLICAPAGFGKSSLLGEWIALNKWPCAWLSLDQADSDVHQFLSYMITALQTIDPLMGGSAWVLLQASPPASPESVLAVLLKQLVERKGRILLVLDDYHLAASKPVDDALAFMIDHLPQSFHLILATREEPTLSLARLRVQGQLNELRQDDLRFERNEAAAFFNQRMKLKLSAVQIAALETRTEGWIVGLQLAAISLKGHSDPDQFIQSFTGSHRFVQDFLLEEVLNQQSQEVQSFLLRTSVLKRLCGPLCDAVMQNHDGQRILTYLEQANLFIVPLDAERRWFRYHHLFAELLQQRLMQREQITHFFLRASEWYEANGMAIDAFQQAVAAGDMNRAIRLIEGDGMPLYFRGAMASIIHWLKSQPQSLLASYPRLWLILTWSLMISGYLVQVEVQLQGVETVLSNAPVDGTTQDLWGQVAVLKAWVAVAKHDVVTIDAEAKRALVLLHPANQSARTAAHCAVAVALHLGGNRLAATTAYAQVVAAGKTSGNIMFTIIASMALANIQLNENKLHLAAKSFKDILQIITDPAQPVACDAHLGLARVYYEWNDLDAAESHAQRSSKLAAPLECGAGLSADAMVARVLQLRNQSDKANAILSQAAIAAQTRGFTSRLQEIANLQVLDLLRRGQLSAALAHAQKHQLSLATARALLAQGNASEALIVLASYRDSMQQKGSADELLKTMVLQVVVFDALGREDEALQLLHDALILANGGGFIRLFVDEGKSMKRLLSNLSMRGILPDYVNQLLAAWTSSLSHSATLSIGENADAQHISASRLIESLSTRELDILRLIQQGNSNQKIGEKLFLSLSTVKWHNQNIFNKLQVKRRTEAVAHALALNLLHH